MLVMTTTVCMIRYLCNRTHNPRYDDACLAAAALRAFQ